jgi:hypothetical protein
VRRHRWPARSRLLGPRSPRRCSPAINTNVPSGAGDSTMVSTCLQSRRALQTPGESGMWSINRHSPAPGIGSDWRFRV